MKRIKIIMIALMMTIVTSASAMTYSQAKDQALFLADKMAYELNLTEDQYEAVYQINLDYLMAVNDYGNVYGNCWNIRNNVLKSVLSHKQYKRYTKADYFYRPVYWSNNRWNWRIYSRYAADRYYNSRPTVYVTYRGGNSRNYYTSRTWTKPTQRVVRTTSQPVRTTTRNVRPSTTTGNRTFGNLNTNNVNRNVNDSRNINRVPSYNNGNHTVAQAKPSTNNRSFGIRQATTTTRSTTTTTGRFGNR